MNDEMWPTRQKQSRASREFAVTVIIVVSAVLVGASGGLLIADRGELAGELRSLSERFLGPSSGSAPKSSKPAAQPDTATTSLPGSDLIGAIDCSHGEDSASVSIELGGATLVRSGRLSKPERIYFDLRDSDRSKGAPAKPPTPKTMAVNGPLLAAIRVSGWAEGAARVVLDLKRPCEYSYHLSPESPSRLTIDVQPSDAGTTELKR